MSSGHNCFTKLRREKKLIRRTSRTYKEGLIKLALEKKESLIDY